MRFPEIFLIASREKSFLKLQKGREILDQIPLTLKRILR